MNGFHDDDLRNASETKENRKRLPGMWGEMLFNLLSYKRHIQMSKQQWVQ